jgi:hypothetical protein
MGKEARSQPP